MDAQEPAGVVARHQRKFNRSTRELWDAYAVHRRRVTALLLECAAPGARVCVLGAGNCNDLDLPALLARGLDLTLVDLDGDAVREGVARQVAGLAPVHVFGDVDLSGLIPTQDAWWERGSTEPPTRDEILYAVGAAMSFTPPDLGGPFDIVLSACVMTQLIDAVANTLGREHPDAPRLARAVRDRHLSLLVDLCMEEGTALLVSDVLSDRQYGGLPRIPEEQLPAFLAHCARTGSCYEGTNPDHVGAAFRASRQLAVRVARTEVKPAWRWTAGELSLLVYAMLVTCRRPGTSPPGASS